MYSRGKPKALYTAQCGSTFHAVNKYMGQALRETPNKVTTRKVNTGPDQWGSPPRPQQAQ